MAITGGLILVVIWRFSSTQQFRDVSSKTTRITTGVSGRGLNQGDESGRGGLAEVSFGTFLNHPFFGVGPVWGASEGRFDSVGSHSSWIDSLAEYGLLGLVPLLAFFVATGRRLVREALASRSMLSLSRIASFVVFVLAGLVNPVLFITPIMILFIVVTLPCSNVGRRQR